MDYRPELGPDKWEWSKKEMARRWASGVSLLDLRPGSPVLFVQNVLKREAREGNPDAEPFLHSADPRKEVYWSHRCGRPTKTGGRCKKTTGGGKACARHADG